MRLVITLKRDELLYDVENYSFVEGDIMTDDAHGKHQVFDIAQEGNEDLVTRMFNLAHAECTEALYPYTKSPCVSDEPVDDTLVAPEQYDFNMTVPSTFSQTTVVLLKEILHKYFVVRVLTEWMSITNTGTYERWQEKLDALKAQLRTALLHRRGRVRIAQHPF